MASSNASQETTRGHSSNPSWDSVSTPPVPHDSPSWEDENLTPPIDPRAKLRETKLQESQRGKNGRPDLRPKPRFRDLTFTRTFSAFDRKNEAAANSPFYGFFTLSWLALALFILKTAVGNWRVHGNPLGTNDIMKIMFSRDGKLCRAVYCHCHQLAPTTSLFSRSSLMCKTSNTLASHQFLSFWLLTAPCAPLPLCRGCCRR